MGWLNIVLYIYGLANICGGIYAYFWKDSLMSLVVGVPVGIATVLLTAMTKTKPGIAHRTLGVLSLALFGFWIYRIFEVRAAGGSLMMPMMNALLSLGIFALLMGAHFVAIAKPGKP